MARDLPVAKSGRTAEEVLRETAEIARELILKGHGSSMASTAKGRGNVVTTTDYAVEAAVTSTLRREFPDHGILGEEQGQVAELDGWAWITDPVDGTTNFSRGIPHFAYTIALYYAEDAYLGLTLQPVTDDLYFAKRGGGATWNGRPMHVTDSQSLYESVIALDLGYEDLRAGQQLDLARAMGHNVESLRIAGSAALGLAHAASGQVDLYVHSDLKPWDLAAGLLLVNEAGGTVSDRDGNPATLWNPGVIGGAPAVHRDFLKRYGHLPWRGAGD